MQAPLQLLERGSSTLESMESFYNGEQHKVVVLLTSGTKGWHHAWCSISLLTGTDAKAAALVLEVQPAHSAALLCHEAVGARCLSTR